MSSGGTGKCLVYFSPALRGGLAEYAREQADAIAKAGVRVRLLTVGGSKARAQDHYELLAQLPVRYPFGQGGSRLQSRLNTAWQILSNIRELCNCVARFESRHVLFGAYAEYLAPVWAWQLRRLAHRNVVFGAVVHDPVRDAVVGPLWWHRWSIAEGYSFLREAFVHEPIQLDTVRPRARLKTTVIPHGRYSVLPPSKSREVMRQELRIPHNAKVLLAFGHIRDNKNLDLVIRALTLCPDLLLLVVGKELSANQRPVGYYRQLAAKLGVIDRCRWCTDFVPEAEVGNFFVASDLVMLSYSCQFRSASGVLNVASGYRKPCVASSGPSNLESVVKEFGLGIWVEPDSLEALAAGIRRYFARPTEPEWDRYEREHSWSRNAGIVIEQMFGELL